MSQKDEKDEKQLQARHLEAQRERRAIEEEMRSIGDNIRSAIEAASVEKMNRLKERKLQLPQVYIEASMTERNLAEQLYRGIYERAQAAAESAEAEFERSKAQLSKRKSEVETELTLMEQQVKEATTKLNVCRGELAITRDSLTGSNFGYQRALKNLTGV